MGKLSVSKIKKCQNYERTATYLFTNKLKCSKCGNFLGGHATTKTNGKKYYYYKCNTCKTYFNEIDIEKELKAFMLELLNKMTLLIITIRHLLNQNQKIKQKIIKKKLKIQINNQIELKQLILKVL